MRHTSILSAISLAFGLGLTQNAVAALDRAPVPIKSFNVYSGKYYLAASFSSGSCFSSAKVIFRDPTGKTVNASRSSEKNYPYLTVYLSAIPLDAQCFKGDKIAFATSGPFKVKTNEIRNYTTKQVLWNSSNTVLTPVSPADSPIVDPFLSFTAARFIYCETCSAYTREIALIEVNRKGESAFTPLSSQVGYQVVGRNSDALIVQNRSLNFAMPFLELWLIKPSGWELLARDTFGARDSIQLSSNLQNLIYPTSQGLAVGKTALFSLSIEVSINKRGNEKELFNVKKYGGGFISDLSLSPNDKFAYFTHISRGISSLYQVNLSNSKVFKMGKTIDGFNLEAIDSEGNLIGIIKKKASDESAQGIVKVSLRTLSKAQNIETNPFTFRTNSGPAVIAVGKYLIFNDEATRQLTIIDSTEVEPTLTLSLQSPVDFLSPLPVNWDSKTAIPAIPDINMPVKE